MAVLDEYTRENLALVTGRSITGDDVLSELIVLIAERGLPNCIRSDNGPEFISKRVKGWLNEVGVRTLFIEPGAPWQNGYVESFNSRFRDELLNMEIFNSHPNNFVPNLSSNTKLQRLPADDRIMDWLRNN
ncbi:MAG: hypothetical protein CSA23_05965 [Deltaproteobacteria bacterium]|nr:MAG: hypothetical protein CSA23_05965 [Deltaproteobacteria bacterium]